MRFSEQKAFTIVELLIVIVVVGILAAITIVAFNGVQNRAHDTAVQNDLSNLAKQLRAYHAIEGRYPPRAGFFSSPGNMNLRISSSSYDTSAYNLYCCTDAGTGERFGLAARSKSRKTYTISSESGLQHVGAMGPSWTVSCGAFGESTLSNIEFTYGWNPNTEVWQGVIAD